MLKAIPNRALNIIRSGNFGGADLIQVSSDISRPSFRDMMPRFFLFLVWSIAEKHFIQESHLTQAL